MKRALATLIALSLVMSMFTGIFAPVPGARAAGPAAVNLGSAGNFVILAKTGISTTGTTHVTGDIGVSPAAASFITGFSLAAPPTTFTTSPLVTGKVYAADYDTPTPTYLTTAVGDMQTAYTAAAGVTAPAPVVELGAGNIGGLTIAPGVYKWGTGVMIPTDVTLSGGANDVWIFQIAQTLTVSNGVHVSLNGGAQAANVFWQVAGQTTLGTTSVFNGIILDQTAIVLNTGATLNGRAFAQTAVTLDASVVVAPASILTLTVVPSAGGWVVKSPNQPSYVSGTVVNLTANANPGYHFVNWSGDVAGTSPSATVTMTGSKTVMAFFLADAASSLITHYYNSLLGRVPDTAGYAHWESEIARIQSLGIDVREGFIVLARVFLTSAEYLAKNTTPAAYITDLYETFFNRTPGSSEITYWTDLMAAGMSRDITMNWFVFSPEFTTYMTSVLGTSVTRPENNLVNDLYRGFLNRLPDTVGFNAQLAVMRAAQASDVAAVRSTTLAIALNFLNSQEYINRARTNTQFIEDCYNGILRRGALPAEIQGWMNLLTGGASRTQILTGFVNSREFQLRVDQVIAAGPFIL